MQCYTHRYACLLWTFGLQLTMNSARSGKFKVKLFRKHGMGIWGLRLFLYFKHYISRFPIAINFSFWGAFLVSWTKNIHILLLFVTWRWGISKIVLRFFLNDPMTDASISRWQWQHTAPTCRPRLGCLATRVRWRAARNRFAVPWSQHYALLMGYTNFSHNFV